MDPAHVARLATPFAAVAVVGLVGWFGPVPKAPPGDWTSRPCPAQPNLTADVGTWFRIDPKIGSDGWLTGQRLELGGRAVSRTVSLPAESFAAGPYGSTVLVGDDDERRSRLRLLDPARGCAVDLGSNAEVVRSAVIEPSHRTIVEHRVGRANRADLGVFRQPVVGGSSTRVLEPLPGDELYGPTFTTELQAADDGRVAATSCGETMCRARIVEADGARWLAGELGPVVGFLGASVVAYRPCGGLPCTLLRLDRGGARTTIDLEAGSSRVVGARLVYETGGGRWLAMLGASDASPVLQPLPGGVRLVPRAAVAGGGAGSSGAGWLAPDGRIPAGGPAAAMEVAQ